MRLGASSAVDDRGPRLSRGWMGELIFAFVGCWPVWGPGAVEWSCPAPSGSREGWDTLRCGRLPSGSREGWDTLRRTKCAEGGVDLAVRCSQVGAHDQCAVSGGVASRGG